MTDLQSRQAFAAEQGSPCPNCQNPVRVGQVVLPWNDAGEMHANCSDPYALAHGRGEGDPEAVVLLGSPMRHVPLAQVAAERAALVEALEPFKREYADMGLGAHLRDDVRIEDCDDGGSTLTVGHWRKLMAALSREQSA